MIRTYTNLSQLGSLHERYEYLALDGDIGSATFGFDRWMNQAFYTSREWKRARSEVLARDYGFDLGDTNFLIQGAPIVHHMNPLRPEDIEEASENLFDPEFLISTSLRTHNAIHYGDKKQLRQPYVERTAGDTRLW